MATAMANPEHHYFEFDRRYGVAHIELAAGQVVTRVSVPSWTELVDTLEALTPADTGNFILTPELITTSDIHEFRPDTPALVERRIKDATRLTTRFRAATTLLLGSGIQYPTQPRPHNALLYIRGGQMIGATHKRVMPNPAEDASFAKGSISPVTPEVQPIICSDILEPWHFVAPATRALLVSACWSVPVQHKHSVASNEAQIRAGLPGCADFAFWAAPDVQDIVMADRVPAGAPVSGPFNFHARRAN